MLLPALDGRRYKQTTASLRARARGVRTFDVLGQRPPDRELLLVGVPGNLLPWSILLSTPVAAIKQIKRWHVALVIESTGVEPYDNIPVGPNMDGMMMVFASIFDRPRRQPIIILHPRPAMAKTC